MWGRLATGLLLAAFAVSPAVSAPRRRPRPGSRRLSGRTFSDEAIEQAIAKGVSYLWSLQARHGSFDDGKYEGKYPFGPSALAVYALLASGESAQSDKMLKALAFLSANKDGKGKPCTKTYSLGLRANVWLLAEQKSRGKYRRYLIADAGQLVRSTVNGAYGYDAPGTSMGAAGGRNKKKKARWDNSNSQYGLLGVWAAAQANVEVHRLYWPKVMKHWMDTQNSDGGWGYRTAVDSQKASRGTMTAAGLASLFVCFDNINYKQFITCKGNTDFPPIKRGLDWLDRNYGKGGGNASAGSGYYLYGIERVGLASGYKYFGRTDWYKVGATRILQTQMGNGAWPGGHGTLAETAFRLLFLVRGRHPVLFNKLQFDGDWNNRPRDLAGLTRWASQAFERTVNWQIINLNAPVREWHDAPLLYISGAKKPNFSDKDIEKLREFVHQGGTLFCAVECGGTAFRTAMLELYGKLFPNYELTRCTAEHPIYSVHVPLPGRPKFSIVSNGVRPLVIHTDEDLPKAWQLRLDRTQRHAFSGPLNAALYVADSLSSLRPRGVSHWPEPPTGRTAKTVKLARVRYNGNFNPEPLAFTRFARMMAGEADTDVQLLGPVRIAKLPASGAQIAVMTGTGRFELSKAARAALQAYVAGGGTLVIDAAGGDQAFAEAARTQLQSLYGQDALGRLSALSDIYAQPDKSIRKVRYRRKTYQRLRTVEPRLRVILVDGRPGVLFSTEDITAGLVGCTATTIEGYTPRSAFEIMRNIVLSVAEKKARSGKSGSGSKPPKKKR